MVKDYMKDRVRRIFQALRETCDCILIKNGSSPNIDHNFFYVTGLDQGLFEGSYVICYPDGGFEVIVPELESEIAYTAKGHVHTYKNRHEAGVIIKKLLSSFKRIGLNNSSLSTHDYIKLKEHFKDSFFIDVSEALMETRLIKDKEEIEIIRHACSISDKTMENVGSLISENMKEYELAAEIDYLLVRNGADKPAFETISSFGVNTSKPHHTHSDNTLKKNDFIICDFGACYRRYNSDITRTFIYGSTSKKQQEMYSVVAEAQRKGLDNIRSGVPGSMIHNAVASYIDSTPFKGGFIHSTGHSLGLSVHEGPVLSSDSDFILKENMILTVEPGVYIPGYGGVRVEDDILVKKDGYELLTSSMKDLYEL
jgi:Xaa-Pro dipeptidase